METTLRNLRQQLLADVNHALIAERQRRIAFERHGRNAEARRQRVQDAVAHDHQIRLDTIEQHREAVRLTVGDAERRDVAVVAQ